MHLDFVNKFNVIYTDFSKAFDRDNHDVLINILTETGIGDPHLSWIKSYLSNRKQWVKIHGISSTITIPTSGVPQGALLSPLPFLYPRNSV
jgi:Reverse transcriptase (RNA-dependent DNA polymerase)